MKKELYLATQMTLIQIGQTASRLPLETFLEAINNAETVGPILDPTLMKRAEENLQAIKELAEAVLMVKEKFGKTFEAVIKTAIRDMPIEETK